MNFSNRFANCILFLYKTINRTGLLNYHWAQSLFIKSYFLYKKHFEDAYAKLIKKYPLLFAGGNILDIGANIGYTSYVFSKALTSPHKVFAFEPEARNVKILQQTAKSYHFSKSLVIEAAAVGEKEGKIEIWQNEGHHADHRILTDEFRKQLSGQFKLQKVPLVTIDDFLNRQPAKLPINFIKIDVQGYELAVCKGMEKTLAANPNCIVSFEYCPSIMAALGFQAEELIYFFKEKGYYFYRLNKNGTLNHLDFETKLEKNFPDYIDVLCSRRIITQ